MTSASKGSSAKDENVMIVSGRNVYDAFGRVAKAFYPTTEGTGSKSTFNKSFDNVSPTVTVYDVLDRATSVALPDNSIFCPGSAARRLMKMLCWIFCFTVCLLRSVQL